MKYCPLSLFSALLLVPSLSGWASNPAYPVVVWAEILSLRRTETHNKTLVVQNPPPVSSFSAPRSIEEILRWIDHSPEKLQQVSDPQDPLSIEPICNVKKLVNAFQFEPGYRLGMAWMGERDFGEVRYLVERRWKGEWQMNQAGALSLPGVAGATLIDYADADSAQVKYISYFQTGEINYHSRVSPRRKEGGFVLSWMIGGRSIFLRDHFTLLFQQGRDQSLYKIKTDNGAGMVQLGADLRWHATRKLSWDLMVKAGTGINWAKEKLLWKDQNNTVIVRDFHQTRRKASPFLTEVNITAKYRLLPALYFQVGYEMLYLSGVAFATDQFLSDPQARKPIYMRGVALIYGLSGGVILKI